MKLHMQNPNTGIKVTAPIGISWTTLFFCPIPAICRGDWKSVLIQLVLLGIAPILTNIVFAITYNKTHVKELLGKGFKVVDVEGGTLQLARDTTKIDLPTIS
jgi:hypothetical protein|tara:strand:+ start:56 stop:361 length:306 start_codon:yes stop_codon:yes gene_type:complete